MKVLSLCHKLYRKAVNKLSSVYTEIDVQSENEPHVLFLVPVSSNDFTRAAYREDKRGILTTTANAAFVHAATLYVRRNNELFTADLTGVMCSGECVI